MTTDPASETISTPLTALAGIRHPILLAPMDGTACARLAAAVSDAGGLGLLGGGYADPAWMEQELAAAEGSRVGAGFITFVLAERPRALGLALEAKVPAVQLSFGDPRPFAEEVKAAGALLICQVQTDVEIARALEAGADVLVAQGRDAGGHGRPDRGTMGLVPSLVDRAGDIPVVAAGGISDGRGLAAALMLGATGVSMGTRFLASVEAQSSPAEAAGLVASGAEDTRRTPVFDVVRGPAWPDGYDGRVVSNQLVQRWEDDPAGVREQRAELKATYDASAPDDFTTRALWAGEGLDLVTSIDPAAAIVERTVASAAARLAGAADLLH